MIDLLKKVGKVAAVIGIIWIIADPASAANFLNVIWVATQDIVSQFIAFLRNAFKN